MHFAPMEPVEESKGTLGEPEQTARTCPRCGQNPVTHQRWESECGGFVDAKYTCGCGHVWWVDGPDS
jgi:hypothetical protein